MRRTWQPPEGTEWFVLALAAAGLRAPFIAGLLNVSAYLVRKHFGVELAVGRYMHAGFAVEIWRVVTLLLRKEATEAVFTVSLPWRHDETIH